MLATLAPRPQNKLRDAYAVLLGIPDECYTPGLVARYHWTISGGELWHTPTDVSEVIRACSSGWLALHPDFRRAIGENWHDWCRRQFGTQWILYALFGERGETAASYDGEAEAQDLTDKQLALYRIRRLLVQSPERARHGVLVDTVGEAPEPSWAQGMALTKHKSPVATGRTE